MNAIEVLPTIELAPSGTAKRVMIILHGLGADGHDFVPIVQALNLHEELQIRFIFPHAPIIPITINSGYQMRGWYDIAFLAFDKMVDIKGIEQSIREIEKLVEQEEKRGIATENIIIAGFSQGAAIALSAGLLHRKKLAGLIALSGYLPNLEKVIEKIPAANKQTPVFVGHGTLDPVVPFALGKSTADELIQAGFNVSFHPYHVPHTVCPNEIVDISNWIQQIWHVDETR